MKHVYVKSSFLRFSADPVPSTLAVMSTVWLILSSFPPPSVPSALYISTPTLDSCQQEAMNCIQGELGLPWPLLPPLLHHEEAEAASGYSQMLRKPYQNAAKQILPKRIQTATMMAMRMKEVMISQRKHQQRERGQQGQRKPGAWHCPFLPALANYPTHPFIEKLLLSVQLRMRLKMNKGHQPISSRKHLLFIFFPSIHPSIFLSFFFSFLFFSFSH